ncbi:uncharacterized protein [Henckelia pumila]|uniref:uncharacterized protein n=1 Tax=Henckelia pumila TaxID=405737 RepID=UPI003C6DB7C3
MLARDIERRQINPPKKFGHADLVYYALNIAEQVELNEPTSYNVVVSSNQCREWTQEMIEEISALDKNNTWKLKDRPKDHMVIKCKWIFKEKETNQKQKKVRFKARLVAKAHLDLELERLDVTTAFLHGELEETIYMDQPKGFIEPKNRNMCDIQVNGNSRSWILRYLRGSSSLGLMFKAQGNQTHPIVVYVDSDYGGNLDTRKSMTRMFFMVFGTKVSWKAIQQPVVALSNTESEYISLTEGIKEAMWIKCIMKEFDIEQKQVERIKMRAILIQLGLLGALEGEEALTRDDKDTVQIMLKA